MTVSPGPIAFALPPVPPVPTSPCEPWPFEEDCCSLPAGDHSELIEKMGAVSTKLLYAAGGRVHGLCAVPVRPCLKRCADTAIGVGYYPSFIPYIDRSGAWQNMSTCACVGDCSCTELCEIVLEGPVASITSVQIDGITIPPSSYRLDLVGEQARLLRTDYGGCWPHCQDIQAACDEPGAFCVTYMQGIPLDKLAIAAHSELVCELVKGCIPNCVCRIPKNVSRKVRSGLTIEFDTAQSWIRNLPLVDAWIMAVNPYSLMEPLRVLSVDARGPRRAR